MTLASERCCRPLVSHPYHCAISASNAHTDVLCEILSRVMMDSNPLPPGWPHQTKGRRLACRQCQRRKIKCDRSYPCIQCEQASITCESSSRKKRTPVQRDSRRDDEIRERLDGLERLVHKLHAQNEPADSGQQSSSTASNKYMASSFWDSLSSEVRELREALEKDDDVSDHNLADSGPESDTLNVWPSQNQPLQQFEFILSGPSSIHIMPGAIFEPDEYMSTNLNEIYLDRIERTYKISHLSSLRALMSRNQPYLSHAAADPCNQALRSAIHFCAISQLTEAECEQHYSQRRIGLLNRLRCSVETNLAQADLLNSTALPALQALLLYVVGRSTAISTLHTSNVVLDWTSKKLCQSPELGYLCSSCSSRQGKQLASRVTRRDFLHGTAQATTLARHIRPRCVFHVR